MVKGKSAFSAFFFCFDEVGRSEAGKWSKTPFIGVVSVWLSCGFGSVAYRRRLVQAKVAFWVGMRFSFALSRGDLGLLIWGWWMLPPWFFFDG